MSDRKFVTIVEIDIDRCTRTFGNAPCLAALSANVPRKCYNTFQTCAYTEAYNKGVNTLKFIEPTYAVKSGNYLPHLLSIEGYEQELNIGGFSPKTGALGVRASIGITFRDFPDRDVLTDKYFAERISGEAQNDEPGYDPINRGSFWTKFRARNPNYAGRPMRVIKAYIGSDGMPVHESVRSYVIDTMEGPDRQGNVNLTVKDVMSLVDDVKAIAPVASRGRLASAITALDTSLTLTPSGIGAEYPVSGYATIGSEIVEFTRSGDVLSITRAQRGTSSASHSASDTVQVAFDVVRVRADDVIYQLLTEYGNIPTSYINLPEWKDEFNKWGAKLLLTATICKPTGVSKLIGEINQLGITVWWDEIAQKIRLKLTHPPEETPKTWSDSKNIIAIEAKDNDEDRVTRVEMWTVQIDPTKDLTESNFLRGFINVSVDSESPFMFNGQRTEKIICRWLNHGADSTVKINTGRLLNRYKRAPKTYEVTVDKKDTPELTDVISLESHVATDETGKQIPTLTQVFYRADGKDGTTATASLQSFQFSGNYGVITENSRPLYGDSSEAQRKKGTYFVGPSLKFSDGRDAYQFI